MTRRLGTDCISESVQSKNYPILNVYDVVPQDRKIL